MWGNDTLDSIGDSRYRKNGHFLLRAYTQSGMLAIWARADFMWYLVIATLAIYALWGMYGVITVALWGWVIFFFWGLFTGKVGGSETGDFYDKGRP